jgi:Na+/H+ antiporter NhaD/arsenite permease-like protein
MNIPLTALLVVFLLVAVRRVGRVRIAIWQAMTGGALVVLATGAITPAQAVAAVDVDVMLFLFGMFVVGQALTESGYLYHLAYEVFSRTRSTGGLVLALLVGSGLGSALLLNDTLAIVGTPLALRLAREHRLEPRLLLLALAFGVTLGSVPSPIGNPQNLLIAVRGDLSAPFLTFLGQLLLPTLVNLLAAYGLLRWLYRREFHAVPLVHTRDALRDPVLAALARLALLVVLAMVAAKVALVALGSPWDFRLSYIALAGALPLLLASPRRAGLLRRLDWPTLLFFASMFVLTTSVWETGVFQRWLGLLPADPGGVPVVLAVSVGMSQLISNVPLVALYLPVIQATGASEPALMALAAGSTIAGNLLILGAASNVIIVEAADRHRVHLDLVTFARVGVPLTLINVAVYAAFLA